MGYRRWLGAGILAAALCGPAHAQCTARSTVLAGESGAVPDEGFGFAVGLGGDVAVIGSSAGESADGRATVFRNVGSPDGWEWLLDARLGPADPADRVGYGRAVAVSGGTIVVGAPGPVNVPGRSFIYEFDGAAWSEVARLSPNAGSGFADRFGVGVSILGDVAAIGAEREGGMGAVYVYRRDAPGAWRLEAKIPARAGGAFGRAVRLLPDSLVVSAPEQDQGHGAVQFYLGAGWPWRQELTGWNTIGYGRAIGADDHGLLVSTARLNGMENEAGDVEAFARADFNWGGRFELASNDACAGRVNGFSLAVEDDLGAVGTPSDPFGPLQRPGVVYIYRLGTEWLRGEQFSSPVGDAADDYYGWSVALDRGRLLVGAPGAEPGPGLVGLAHLTELSDGAPFILTHPRRQFIDPGEDGVLTVVAAGEDPLEYRWQWRLEETCDYTDLSDGDLFQGTDTQTLRIVAPEWDEVSLALFRCRVSNGCGAAYSDDGEVVVSCVADWTGDGRVDTRDIVAFLNIWYSGDPICDVNRDGAVDTRDLIAFLNIWRIGC